MSVSKGRVVVFHDVSTPCSRFPCSSRWRVGNLVRWSGESISAPCAHLSSRRCLSYETILWQTVPEGRRPGLPVHTRMPTLPRLSLRHRHSNGQHPRFSATGYDLEKQPPYTRDRLSGVGLYSLPQIVGIGHIHL